MIDGSEERILGDPGADSGGEGKSKQAGKYGTKDFRPFRLSLAPTICPWVPRMEKRSNKPKKCNVF